MEIGATAPTEIPDLRSRMTRIARCTLLLTFLALSACATVPRESVQLSQAIGNDIQELHAGYRATIQAQFQLMRQNGLEVIENRWVPTYLASFVEDGRLVDFARAGNTEAVEYWARVAIQAIDGRRQEFLDSMDQRERALLAQVDEAFGRVTHANATLTGLLRSATERRAGAGLLRATGEVGSLGVRELVSRGIDDASDFVSGLASQLGLDAGP